MDVSLARQRTARTVVCHSPLAPSVPPCSLSTERLRASTTDGGWTRGLLGGRHDTR